MFVYRMNELAKGLPAGGLTSTRCMYCGGL